MRIAGQLVNAAKGQSVTLSLEMKPYQRVTVEWIGGLKGSDFDREHVQFVVMDEESMAEEFRREVESGRVRPHYPPLRSLARGALPGLKTDFTFARRS